MRPDLALLDQSSSGRGVKLYAPPMVWLNFYDQNNTTRVGLCIEQITCTDNYSVAKTTDRL